MTLKYQHVLTDGSMVALPTPKDTQSQGWFLYDIETNGLIDSTTIDYTQSPYKPKPDFKIHCVVFIDYHTEEVFIFDGDNLTNIVEFIKDNVEVVIGHNIIDFDLLACKILLNISYNIAIENNEPDLWVNKPVEFIDTLVFAKVLNPDRYTGYSLDALTQDGDIHKIDWRERAIELGYIQKTDPQGAEFAVYSAEMLNYCIRDCQVNGLLLSKLLKEAEGWDWVSAHKLEKAVRDIITRQSHRGFLFGYDKALGFVRDLDNKLQERRALVEPLIPPKPLTKGKLDAITPPTRQLVYATPPQVPKTQIKKDGSPSQAMLKYAEKVGGTIEYYDLYDENQANAQDVLWLRVGDSLYSFSSVKPLEQDTVPFEQIPTLSTNIENWVQKHNGTLFFIEDEWYAELYGVQYQLPIPCEPLATTEPAKISDTTHLKGWLISLGWEPSNWKEKDLTMVKKVKLSPEKYAATAQRYIDQTLESPFYGHRLAFLGINHKDKAKRDAMFRDKLLNHTGKYGMKVITNPILTVGQSKEIDPALLALVEKFPYAKEVSEYLTYQHRRNSIVGGNVDPDDEDEEINKGFLSVDRIYQDGRIPTPADSCGCNTSRMKMRVVVNIPRASSLYGHEMRSLFGVDPTDFLLLGYDFSSLEARIESHYTYRYDNAEKSYSTSLLGEQPNDVHCFDKETQILTLKGWLDFSEVTLDTKVAQWQDGNISFVYPTSVIYQKYTGKMVYIKNRNTSQCITPNHRILCRGYKSKYFSVKNASDLLNTSYQYEIYSTGLYNPDTDPLFPFHIYQLALITQADGCLHSDCSAIIFNFSKARKIKRLVAILDSHSIAYSINEDKRHIGGKYIRIFSSQTTLDIRFLLDDTKSLTDYFIHLPLDWRLKLIDEVAYWDGTIRKSGSIILDTTSQKTVSVLQTMCALSDVKTFVNTYTKSTTYSDKLVIHRLYISKTPNKTVIDGEFVSSIDYDDYVGCVTVPSSFVIVKRENKIVISGNSITALMIADIIQKPFSRQDAKSCKYAATYGASAKKIGKTIGADDETGQKVFDAFWLAAKPLADLKTKLEQYWEKIGNKKFVLGLDGRKVPTRAKSALINSLFQSAGVICAKRAMVLHEKLLREHELICDFWTDDWRESTFVQQLGHFHDEAQIELSKSLVEYRLFPVTEWQTNKKGKPECLSVLAEVQKFKQVNPYWSNIKQTDEGYLITYSIVGELALKAVVQAGEYYNLNVPLAADYAIATSWDSTH